MNNTDKYSETYIPNGETRDLKINMSFKDGLRTKGIHFQPYSDNPWKFTLGYCLWGMDIWVNNIPIVKVLIGVNIVNMILVWIVR